MTKVDWSNFSGFAGLKQQDLKTAFGDNVGGAFFAVGTHKDVTIDSIEPQVSRAGNAMLKTVFKNDNGAQITKYILITDKEGKPGFQYQQLASALVSDKELRMDFFVAGVEDNPALIDSLRGLKLSLTIVNGKEGYIVKKDAIGDGYLMVDIESDAPYEEVADVLFESYTDIKDKAKELGISRCWPEVNKLFKGGADVIEANEAVLREVLSTGGAAPTDISKAKSAASRPAI